MADDSNHPSIEAILGDLIELPKELRAQKLKELNLPESVTEKVDRILTQSDHDESGSDFLEELLFPSSPTVSPNLNAESGKQSLAGEFSEMVGPYQLLHQVGAGGMGTVFLAVHRRLEKQFAIKFLPEVASRSQVDVARFEREVKIAGRLDHPNLVAASDAGVHRGQHYLVMELVDGPSAGDLVEENGPLSVEQSCQIIQQSIQGIQSAHQLGLIHRDIKPSNLMVDIKGQVKVVDFGLAALHQSDSSITRSNQVLGTVDFMAPEQAASGIPVGSEVDIYGLGATFYKLLTGKTPYQTDQPKGLLEKIALLTSQEPVPVKDRGLSIPTEICDLIGQMLQRDPSKRPDFDQIQVTLSPFTNHESLLPLVQHWVRPVPTKSSGPFFTNDIDEGTTRTDLRPESSETIATGAKVAPVSVSRRAALLTVASVALLCAAGWFWSQSWNRNGIQVRNNVEAVFLTCKVKYSELADPDFTVLEKFYRMSEQLNLRPVNNLVQLVYETDPQMSESLMDSPVEVRVQINRRMGLPEKTILDAATQNGLKNVAIKEIKGHRVAFQRKPSKTSDVESLKLWAQLIEFAEKKSSRAELGYPTETFDIQREFRSFLDTESELSIKF